MNWKSLLSNVSETLLLGDDLQDEFKGEGLNWLGYEGASEEEIANTERRLNTSLPPSYKEFLKVSNGFKQLNCFVWNILPVDKIDWLEKFEPTLFDLYSTEFKDAFNPTDEEYFVYGEKQKSTDFRSEYLINSLAVSEWGDAAMLLLNPKVKFGDEWEAWMFATWHLGPIRYKSFEELMQEEYSSYLELLHDRE
jgi:hypothetical protein